MLEERYSVVKIVESCKSMSELIEMLDEFQSKAIEFTVFSNGDGTVAVGVTHYEAKISTIIDKDGRAKPIVIYIDSPCHWYNVMPPQGFVFDD